jgi:hypothetical protein
MTELYTILDQNEIDGSSKDVEIVTNGNPDDETTWTDVLTHTQFVPAGEYQFLIDWMIEVHQNEEYYWRMTGSVDLPVTEVKTERQSGRYYFQYGFPYSWPFDGDFELTLQFKAKDAAGLSDAWVRYADFTLTRRS